jgi:TIR domain
VPAASDRKPSVFVSYRRETGFYLAKYIFDRLHLAGYDVFMDVHSLGAGEFEQTTLAQIAARDYFLLVITPGSLRGMTRKQDWLRKELMQAVESKRTVVPVLADGVKFEDADVQEVLRKLPPVLRDLPSFNAIRIPPPEYFDSAMKRLISFLKITALSAPSTPKPSREAAATKIRIRKAAAPPKSVTQAQSALHGLTLPPPTSLPKTQSAAPWSALQATLPGSGLFVMDAPTLEETFLGVLKWTKVPPAYKYVLEESIDSNFGRPSTVYEGRNTSYRPKTKRGLFQIWNYRVKAIGLGRESDWSNVVIITGKAVTTQAPRNLRQGVSQSERPAPFKLWPLATPSLKEDISGGLTWTGGVLGATYVLEVSRDRKFTPGKVAYKGPNTSWVPHSSFPGRLQIPVRLHYRVKAIGLGVQQSPWSNVVGIDVDRSNWPPRS